jgi:uncharacterized membrane protein YfhO
MDLSLNKIGSRIRNIGSSLWTKLSNYKKKGLKQERIAVYGTWTAIYVFVATIVYGYIFSWGKSLVSKVDPKDQHVPAFIYWGKYLRAYFRQIIHADSIGDFVPKMFDFSIGFGSDVLQTLHYYVIGNPLYLISVFFPVSYGEYLYDFIIIFTPYLAGVFFIWFCRYVTMQKLYKISSFGMIVGSLTFSFCGFAFMTYSESMYASGLWMFPLLLLGIEKILNERKCGFFAFATFLVIISNYYFSFMAGVASLVYFIVRLICGKKIIKKKVVLIFKVIIGGFVGIFLSAPIAVPEIYATINSPRIVETQDLNIFYPIQYYSNLILSLFAPYLSGENEFILSLCLLSVIALIILFKQKNKYNDIKVLAVIFIVFSIFPFFGLFLNGFQYPSGRWSFVIEFFMSFILAVFVEKLCEIKKYKKMIIIFFMIYSLLVCLILFLGESSYKKINYICPFLLMFIFFSIWEKLTKTKIIIFCIFGIVFCDVNMMNISDSFNVNMMNTGEFNKNNEESAAVAIENIGDNSFYRYDSNSLSIDKSNQDQKASENEAIFNNVHSTTFKYSLGNKNVFSFEKELGLPSYFDYYYSGLDSRSILSLLSGVKYYALSKDYDSNKAKLVGVKSYVPYFYSKYKDTQYQTIYKTQESLPFGYTYTHSISNEDFNSLNIVNKEKSLLSSVVYENSDLKDKMSNNNENFMSDLNAEIKCSGMMDCNGSKITFNSTSDFVEIQFESNSNTSSQYYLIMDGLEVVPNLNSPKFNIKYNTLKNGNFEYTKKYYTSQSFFGSDQWGRGSLDIIGLNGYTAWHKTLADKAKWSFSKRFYVANLGKVKTDKIEGTNTQKIKIKSNGPMTLNISSIKIVSEDLSDVKEKISALKQDTLKNVNFSNNKITGDITLKEPKILVTQIPYTDGAWVAYDNGKKVDLKQANIAFSGLELQPGKHHIVFKYQTPGLKIGFYGFGVGLILLICILIWEKRTKNKNSVKPSILLTELHK